MQFINHSQAKEQPRSAIWTLEDQLLPSFVQFWEVKESTLKKRFTTLFISANATLMAHNKKVMEPMISSILISLWNNWEFKMEIPSSLERSTQETKVHSKVSFRSCRRDLGFEFWHSFDQSRGSTREDLKLQGESKVKQGSQLLTSQLLLTMIRVASVFNERISKLARSCLVLIISTACLLLSVSLFYSSTISNRWAPGRN